jgi:carboxyl-terminal processing protease
VRAYLIGALDLIQRTALFSDSVDWVAVREDADAVAARAGGYADTHALLGAVLRQAGGRHSRLIPPQDRRAALGPAMATLGPARPTGRIIEATGYLRLPWLPDGLRLARGYVTSAGRLLDVMAAAKPRGWIVDLRDNAGGNMWPMLAAAAPLLPEGVLGHFVLPGHDVQPWTWDRGRVRLDGRSQARSRSRLRPGGPARVAVLTSHRTASAGEAVAVAFRARPTVRAIGTPTAGFATGNQTHTLRDGTRLRITGCYYADRDRNEYHGPVPVDQEVDGDDPAGPLRGALAWLSRETPG